jgi:cell division protein FtsB
MSLKQIRVNEFTVKDLRRRGEKYGDPTDDAMIRIVLAENDLLKSEKSENECLKKRNADLEKEVALLKRDNDEFKTTLEKYIGIKRKTEE